MLLKSYLCQIFSCKFSISTEKWAGKTQAKGIEQLAKEVETGASRRNWDDDGWMMNT